MRSLAPDSEYFAFLDVLRSAHTAMCLQNGASADVLGEFSIAEAGGIDGEPGD